MIWIYIVHFLVSYNLVMVKSNSVDPDLMVLRCRLIQSNTGHTQDIWRINGLKDIYIIILQYAVCHTRIFFFSLNKRIYGNRAVPFELR
jgi:hypothetical protein